MGEKSELRGFGELDEDIVNALIDNPYECPIVIDKKGIIRYIDVHNINERPSLETLVKELEKLR